MNTMLILAEAADNAAGILFGLTGAALIVTLVAAAAASIFWLWMLFDALTNAALDSTMKIVWALVVFFGHFLGALIYFFVGRKPRPAALP